MDFIVGLPLSACKFDSIWVIIDRFTKSAHFIPVHTNYMADKYTELYIACILCVIPRSEIEETEPPYVCLGCFIHTYSNNMINRFPVQ
jgi:hypothetical protein